MTKNESTYRISWIAIAALAWEIFFWILIAGLLFLLGYLDNGSLTRLDFFTPEAFWLYLLMLPLTGVYFWNLIRVNKLSESFGSGIRKMILRPVDNLSTFLRFFFFRNTFAFLILSLAQPVFGTKKVSGTIESLELVICLDVSASMDVKDISDDLSRLDVSKRAIVQLINNLHGEKIGICVFAGGAYVQLPITSDYSAAKLFVNDITTSIMSNQGTNINAALSTANDMFTDQKCSKGIIIVTDGENHEEKPTSIFEIVKKKNITVNVLGIGSKSGGPVPINPDRPELGYKKTPLGTTVVSKVNREFIQSIASKGKGMAILSDDEFPDLSPLLTEINQMKRTKLRDLQFDMKENRYRIPLFAALVCWLVFLFMDKKLLSKRS